jgi:hypothetical protein
MTVYGATSPFARVSAKVSSPFRLQTFFIMGRQAVVF